MHVSGTSARSRLSSASGRRHRDGAEAGKGRRAHQGLGDGGEKRGGASGGLTWSTSPRGRLLDDGKLRLGRMMTGHQRRSLGALGDEGDDARSI
jgi:hypothetical protein